MTTLYHKARKALRPGTPEYEEFYSPMVEEERRNRIRLALAACAYEFFDESIMSDGEFDALSLKIDPEMMTGVPELDWFFSDSFDPSTGSWIHDHPELERVKELYLQMKEQGHFNPQDSDDLDI